MTFLKLVLRFPRHSLWVWSTIVAACYLLTSCLSSIPPRHPELSTLDYFNRIAQIQGFLRSAEELINIDQFDRARIQLDPINRVYADLTESSNSAPATLISLYNLRTQLSVKAFAQKSWVTAQHRRVVKHLNTFAEDSNLQQSLSIPVRLRVIEQQLLFVAQLYKAAMSNPTTIDQTSFDRARGLLLATRDQWSNPIRDQLKAANPLLADQMESALSTLTASLPVTVNRDKATDIQQVEKTIADFVEASRRLVG